MSFRRQFFVLPCKFALVYLIRDNVYEDTRQMSKHVFVSIVNIVYEKFFSVRYNSRKRTVRSQRNTH